MTDEWPAASRTNDIDSSHEAEEALTRSGNRSRQTTHALALLIRYPGRTARELAYMSSEPAYDGPAGGSALARRLNDLRRLNLARHGEMRRCRVGNRKAVEWYAKL